MPTYKIFTVTTMSGSPFNPDTTLFHRAEAMINEMASEGWDLDKFHPRWVMGTTIQIVVVMKKP